MITLNQKTLEELQTELEATRELARTTSVTSADYILLWGEVEELAAAINDRKQNNTEVSSLDTYCLNDPSAPECREFDV
jgi:hypothetical protein